MEIEASCLPDEFLPELLNRAGLAEFWVDMTPDGRLALRLLHAYRRRCDERWSVVGIPSDRTLIYDMMNRHQEERARELDRAIALLEGALD